MGRIKSHTRAWTEDLIATNPCPKPKAKVALSKEELEEAGLTVPTSDEEDFQDPQEPQEPQEETPVSERKRHAEDDRSGEGGAELQNPRVRRRTGESDTIATAPALLGALKAFATALKETADRIAELAEEHGVDTGTPPDHPEAVKMVRLLSRRLNLNQEKVTLQVKEELFDPKWFPVITIDDENRPDYRGEEALRDPEDFRRWAVAQDSRIASPRGNQVGPQEWATKAVWSATSTAASSRSSPAPRSSGRR